MESLTPSLSVVIPTYRGEDRIASVLAGVQAALAGENLEIIVVDDGGGPDSRDALEALIKAGAEAGVDAAGVDAAGRTGAGIDIRLISFDTNRGQQEATIAGAEAARGTWIVTIDDDGEQDPSGIPILLGKARAGYDLVYGYPADTAAGSRPGSSLRDGLFRSLLGAPRHLRVTSFRCFSRELWKKVEGHPKPSFLYLSALLLREGPRAASLPVAFQRRGASRYRFTSRLRLFLKLFWHYGVRRGRRWC